MTSLIFTSASVITPSNTIPLVQEGGRSIRKSVRYWIGRFEIPAYAYGKRHDHHTEENRQCDVVQDGVDVTFDGLCPCPKWQPVEPLGLSLVLREEMFLSFLLWLSFL